MKKRIDQLEKRIKKLEKQIAEKSTISFDSPNQETEYLFPGMSFKYPPVSKEEYINAYKEYVRRCSS
ncbi:hypothetical protein AQ616_17890 [Oceanobacillus sp. E9]|uniref:hypothetical protein n=1 Tax=Oceanobacillus TaxID=182709 RepID=UPI00034B72F6|nr:MULTISPECIES: hypothetical protein [Oceanobacillus]OEH53152.1 hypothetical protein AQ616_17890 [Oceanobacillus sp. E9]